MEVNNTINTGKDIYLVEFQNSTEQFICTWEDIQNPLKLLNDKYYLKFIFRYNPSEKRFLKVPKKLYKTLFSVNTEAILLLEKYKFVK